MLAPRACAGGGRPRAAQTHRSRQSELRSIALHRRWSASERSHLDVVLERIKANAVHSANNLHHTRIMLERPLLLLLLLKAAACNKGCECWSTPSDELELEVECNCEGAGVVQAWPGVQRLTLSDATLVVMARDSLQLYRSSLRDVTLTDMRRLEVVEPGAFRSLRFLRTIYISEAPVLTALPDGFLDGVASSFKSLRVMRTGLRRPPDLRALLRAGIVHMIDLEGNRIHELQANSIHVKAEQVILNYNAIEAVDGWAFNGSEIAKLSLKGNRALNHLSDDAFSGLHSLRDLDLSETAIARLPTAGLGSLEVLRIRDTTSLTVIPSVYSFKHLREAWLTYSFHCCAFRYPEQHDPIRHALHQAYLASVRKRCHADYNDTGQQGRRVRRGAQHEQDEQEHVWGDDVLDFSADQPSNEWDHLSSEEDDDDEDEEEEEEEQSKNRGVFHQTTAGPPRRHHAVCGTLSARAAVRCRPAPDALNPCEDIMGFTWLRVCVWLVVVTAVLGNAAVLMVLLSASQLSPAKFLMCNLAFADLCMGAYLMMLASADLHSRGAYFNFAYHWQRGAGCQVAGFLTVFASQLSVFTLSLLTLERWMAITYALYLDKRLKLRAAAHVMGAGWLYAIAMAALPLVGVSSYSTTSICLPMETGSAQDVTYLVSLLAANALAFGVVCVCYAQIYLSLGRDTRHGSEMTVAKRMALLIFTDFACWAPIAFFGLTAVAGYPLIDVTRSKILLVFFYPINSCANPYLYAILTAQYRRDLFLILSRYGMCTRAAQQYKMTCSLPTNNSNPLPLLPRGTTSVAATSNGQEEASV